MYCTYIENFCVKLVYTPHLVEDLQLVGYMYEQTLGNYRIAFYCDISFVVSTSM